MLNLNKAWPGVGDISGLFEDIELYLTTFIGFGVFEEVVKKFQNGRYQIKIINKIKCWLYM